MRKNSFFPPFSSFFYEIVLGKQPTKSVFPSVDTALQFVPQTQVADLSVGVFARLNPLFPLKIKAVVLFPPLPEGRLTPTSHSLLSKESTSKFPLAKKYVFIAFA